MKVMSAIERCRTWAFSPRACPGGATSRAARTAPTPSSPTTAAATGIAPSARPPPAKEWLAEREAELLPVGYFHLVFTLPGPIADIAYHNKAAIYGLLFTAAAEATTTVIRRGRL